MNAEKTISEVSPSGLRPRFENHRPMLIAGLREHYTFETLDDIPEQWVRFVSYLGAISGQVGEADYGLCIDMFAGTDGFDYVTGIEVTSEANLPTDWVTVRVPAQIYAIFSHDGHVSTIRDTARKIGEEWLPSSGREVVQAAPGKPNLIERYGPEFNPNSGTGGIELWLPIKG